MDTMHNDRLTALLMLALIFTLIGGCIGWFLKPCPCDGAAPVGGEIKRDTIREVRFIPPFMAEGKAKVRRTTRTEHDTVFLPAEITDEIVPDDDIPKPDYVATLDTIIGKDTASLRYDYRSLLFAVDLRRAPDSINYVTTTITLTKYEQRPWWIDALTHVGAATLGFAFGQSQGK
ncbi:MAG: hypothetical protein JSS89_13315 [Bacteroidetes bacterium]|nr:hypothetical protein [Bacteroidota bacterium]